MAVYYTCCYGDMIPEYYVSMMLQKIEKMTGDEYYVTHGISWSKFRLGGEIQKIQLPIRAGYVWSNHGNYWLWSTKKPVWIPRRSMRSARGGKEGLYTGESYRLNIPYFNEGYMPDWVSAKDSLYEVIN